MFPGASKTAPHFFKRIWFSGVRPSSGAAGLSAGEGFWNGNVAAAEDGSSPGA